MQQDGALPLPGSWLGGRSPAEGVSPPVGEASRVMLNVRVHSSLTSHTALSPFGSARGFLSQPLRPAPDGFQRLLLLDAAEPGSGQSHCHVLVCPGCSYISTGPTSAHPEAGEDRGQGSSPWPHSAGHAAEQGEEREMNPGGRNVSPPPSILASWCSIKTPSRGACTCVPCHSPAHLPVLLARAALGWHGTDPFHAIENSGSGTGHLHTAPKHLPCPLPLSCLSQGDAEPLIHPSQIQSIAWEPPGHTWSVIPTRKGTVPCLGQIPHSTKTTCIRPSLSQTRTELRKSSAF